MWDAELGLAVEVFPCEDGHAPERALLAAVAATVQPGEVWIADRNFGVTPFLCDIPHQEAFFVIRWHQQMPDKPWSERADGGTSATGEVFEQPVPLTAAEGETLRVRRGVIQ